LLGKITVDVGIAVATTASEFSNANKAFRKSDDVIKITDDFPAGAKKIDDVIEGGLDTISTTSPYDLAKTHSQTLSNNQLNKLVDNIKTNGIQEPIKYVEYNGTKYVVDGHHRLLAAKKLGLTEVPVEKIELPFAGYKTINDLLWVD